MDSLFLENFKEYKKLKESGYKFCNKLILIELFLWSLPTFISLFFYLTTQNSKYGLLTISLMFLFFMYLFAIAGEIEIPFVEIKCNKIVKAKLKFRDLVYSGDIYDIFDADCKNTNKVLKEHKELLKNEIYKLKGISGYTVIKLYQQIFNEKKRDEEIETMILCNTKTGKILKRIEEL